MAESYWRIPQDEGAKLESPLRAFKEQAELLTEQTDALLRGKVRNWTEGGNMLISMSILVPTLNGYAVELFEYRQPPLMFPGEFSFNFSPETERVKRVETYQQKWHFAIISLLPR
jgi:hypothetical protein